MLNRGWKKGPRERQCAVVQGRPCSLGQGWTPSTGRTHRESQRPGTEELGVRQVTEGVEAGTRTGRSLTTAESKAKQPG